MKTKSQTRNFRASLKEGASAASNAVPRALHEFVKQMETKKSMISFSRPGGIGSSISAAPVFRLPVLSPRLSACCCRTLQQYNTVT